MKEPVIPEKAIDTKQFPTFDIIKTCVSTLDEADKSKCNDDWFVSDRSSTTINAHHDVKEEPLSFQDFVLLEKIADIKEPVKFENSMENKISSGVENDIAAIEPVIFDTADDAYKAIDELYSNVMDKPPMPSNVVRNSLEQKSRSKFTYKCTYDECNQICVGRELFVRHSIEVHNFSKDEALTVAKRQIDLHKYARKKERNLNGFYSCKTCNKEFKGSDARRSLARHSKYVHSEKNARCDECTKVFKERRTLLLHIRVAHRGEADRNRAICSLCGKSVTSLKSHMDLSHGQERLSCERCGKILTSTRAQEMHMKHCNNLEKCEECGKILSKLNLKYHMLSVHAPDEMRPYKCSYCAKRYVARKQVTAHVNLIHLGIKPFACEVCPKTFASKQEGQFHVNHAHNDERAFQCEVCLKTYQRKNHLDRHRMKTHNLKTDTTVEKERRFLDNLAAATPETLGH